MYRTTEQIIQEAKLRETAIFASGKYGYQLSVNNAVLNDLYRKYLRLNGQACYLPPSDKHRITWERLTWAYLSKIYYGMYKHRLPSYDKQPLSEHVVGWMYTQLADIISHCINRDEVYKHYALNCDKQILKQS